MSRQGKLIQVPENALKQLQKERMEKIDQYLAELGKHVSIENNDLDLVMRAVLQRDGLPNFDKETPEEFVMRCSFLSNALSRWKLQRLHLGVKQVMKEQNVHDAPDPIVWSARRAGVELLEQQVDKEH